MYAMAASTILFTPVANADNCPAIALSATELDMLILIHLHENEPVDLSFFDGKPIVHLFPSQPLERVSGADRLI